MVRARNRRGNASCSCIASSPHVCVVLRVRWRWSHRARFALSVRSIDYSASFCVGTSRRWSPRSATTPLLACAPFVCGSAIIVVAASAVNAVATTILSAASWHRPIFGFFDHYRPLRLSSARWPLSFLGLFNGLFYWGYSRRSSGFWLRIGFALQSAPARRLFRP